MTQEQYTKYKELFEEKQRLVKAKLRLGELKDRNINAIAIQDNGLLLPTVKARDIMIEEAELAVNNLQRQLDDI